MRGKADYLEMGLLGKVSGKACACAVPWMWGRFRHTEMEKMLAEDSTADNTLSKDAIGIFGDC